MIRDTSLITTLAVLGLACAAPAAPPDHFDVPWIGYDTAVYPEGIGPWSSATADFDGDDVPDLVTVSWGGTAFMSVLFGDGEGGYRPPVTYPILLESLGVVAADFDNDDDIDIVTADTGRFWEGISISLYRNDGQGGFTFAGWFATGENGASGITAADFNRDGWIDVAVAHDDYIVFGRTIAVLQNTNGTGFQLSRLLTLQAGTRAIASGDIDNDDDPDILVGHETNKFTVVRNDGGTFTESAVIPGIVAGSIPEQPTVHLSDVDLDNDLDVLFSNVDTGGVGAGATALWRNAGNGTFGTGEQLSFGVYTSGGVHVQTADVTHDGWPDILAATGGAGDWFLLAGDGAGGFEAARRFRAGEAPRSIQVADLDADDDRDVIVVAADSSEACVYLNPGDGGFVQPPVIDMVDPAIAPAFTTNLEALDIDADGDLDLAIGYRSDFSNAFGISIRRNRGDGTFGSRETYAEFTYAKYIRLRDLNNDDSPDLVWIDSNARLHVRLNFGDGTFGSRRSSHVVNGGGYFDAFDVDNDDDLDLIVATGFDIGVVLNNGDATFAPPRYEPFNDFYEFLHMGDFNGDGNLDLLTDSGVQGYPQISNGNGDGTFDPPNTVPTGRDVHAFAVDHIDHDGRLDFAVVYNLDETGLSVRRGRGDGNFFPVSSVHGSYDRQDHTSSLKLADVDGDGNLDALTANFGAQDFSFWKGNGDGTFERVVRYGVAQPAFDIAYGDFDGDDVGDAAVITRTVHNRWWYPGVVLLKGRPRETGLVVPSTFNTIFGAYQSGSVEDLHASDDRYVRIEQRPAFTPLLPLIRLEVDGVAPFDDPAQLVVTIEAAASSIPTLPPQKLLLRDYDAASWELVDERPATSSDSTVEVVIDVDAGRFIANAGGAVKLRVDWFDPGDVFFPLWGSRTDLALWNLTP